MANPGFNFAAVGGPFPALGQQAPGKGFGPGFGAPNAGAPQQAAFGAFGNPAPNAAPQQAAFGAIGAFGAFGQAANAAPQQAAANGPFGNQPLFPGVGGFQGAAGIMGAPAANNMKAPVNPYPDGGLEGDLRRLFDIRKRYAPTKDPTRDTPDAYQDGKKEKYSTESASRSHQHNWNTDCDFKFTMYIENAVAKAIRPDQLDDLEPSAIAENPEPTKLTPRTYRGLAALQNLYTDKKLFTEKISKEIDDKFNAELNEYERKAAKCANDLNRAAKKHNEQMNRLIKLLARVEVFRCSGEQLEYKELQHSEAYSKLKKMNDMMSERLRSLEDRTNTMASYHTEEELLDLSDKDLEAFYNVLKQQHNGIQQLAGRVRKDIRDVDIIYDYQKSFGINKPPK